MKRKRRLQTCRIHGRDLHGAALKCRVSSNATFGSLLKNVAPPLVGSAKAERCHPRRVAIHLGDQRRLLQQAVRPAGPRAEIIVAQTDSPPFHQLVRRDRSGHPIAVGVSRAVYPIEAGNSTYRPRGNVAPATLVVMSTVSVDNPLQLDALLEHYHARRQPANGGAIVPRSSIW